MNSRRRTTLSGGFAIGAMTQSLIELELGEYFGKRRARRMIQKLDRHFIICGYGRVGRNAASEG
jgi:voltage-gated potassium channel